MIGREIEGEKSLNNNIPKGSMKLGPNQEKEPKKADLNNSSNHQIGRNLGKIQNNNNNNNNNKNNP